MEFEVTAVAAAKFQHEKGQKTSSVMEVVSQLKLEKKLDRSFYFGKDELPNQMGAKAMTSVLISGIVSNIKFAHERGYLNEVDHVKYVIEKISEGFATIGEISIDKPATP